MKTACKRIMSLLLALIMAAAVPVSAFAVTRTAEEIAQEIGCETLSSVSDFSIEIDKPFHIYCFKPEQTGVYRLSSNAGEDGENSTFLDALAFDTDTFDCDTYDECVDSGFEKYSSLVIAAESFNDIHKFDDEGFEKNDFELTVPMLAGKSYIIVIEHFYWDTDARVPISFDFLGEIKSAELVSVPYKIDFILDYDVFVDDDGVYGMFDEVFYHGMEIKLVLESGESVSFYDSQCEVFNASKESNLSIGANTIEFSIYDIKLSFIVNVIENPVQSVEIVSKPDKLTYRYLVDGRAKFSINDGEIKTKFYPNINCTGMEIRINYTDGTSKTFKFSDKEYHYDVYLGYGFFYFEDIRGTIYLTHSYAEIGQTELYVEYYGKTSESIEINVVKSIIPVKVLIEFTQELIFSLLSMPGKGDRVLKNDKFWFKVLRLSPYLKYNSHYQFNSSIEGDMDYIYNQRECPQFLIGEKKMAGVGCEIAATYNALKHLGNDVTCSEIIRDFEKSGYLMLHGIFGSDPYAIGEYFDKKSVEHVQYSSFDEMNEAVKAGRSTDKVYIMSFWNWDGILGGLHTIALYTKEGSDNIYTYNNSYGNVAKGALGLQDLTDSKRFITGYWIKA